jgi:hypothetical protein
VKHKLHGFLFYQLATGTSWLKSEPECGCQVHAQIKRPIAKVETGKR